MKEIKTKSFKALRRRAEEQFKTNPASIAEIHSPEKTQQLLHELLVIRSN